MEFGSGPGFSFLIRLPSQLTHTLAPLSSTAALAATAEDGESHRDSKTGGLGFELKSGTATVKSTIHDSPPESDKTADTIDDPRPLSRGYRTSLGRDYSSRATKRGCRPR
ncbi:hypothetical protein CRG98_014289 [Punica granatum]|uniref:Uncharacterized protein n=1 Tax=Punica granatum TaxID=22663 RepID=A0A2I0K9V7_PUNGR|nr:hypothetical protein CRG98_014289 [Punica granatum]